MICISIFAISAQHRFLEVNEKPDKTIRNVSFLGEFSQT